MNTTTMNATTPAERTVEADVALGHRQTVGSTTNQQEIAASIEDTRSFLLSRPDRGSTADSPVTAVLESGLRCSFQSEHMSSATDMPIRVGGDGSAPSPGHYLRGAIAACTVTAIAMRAAELGIELDDLSATAHSMSDGRSFFGLRDGMVGFTDLTISVDVSASNTSSADLDELIDYASAHAPVGQSVENEVPTTMVWNVRDADTKG